MYQRIYYPLLLLITLIGCRPTGEQQPIASSISKTKAFDRRVIAMPTRQVVTDYIVMGDSIISNEPIKQVLQCMAFTIDKSNNKLSTIVIYEHNKICQQISVNEIVEQRLFSMVDWNFDGYKDITVLANSGSGGRIYFIWNYSPSIHRYMYNQDLSGVLGLSMNSEAKQIIFYAREGFAKEGWDSLRYEQNKLTFKSSLRIDRWNNLEGKIWTKRTHCYQVQQQEICVEDSVLTD
jgi:hypothetical protein